MLHRRCRGELEVYLVERAPELRFFGGYHALPGGVRGPEDGPDEPGHAGGPDLPALTIDFAGSAKAGDWIEAHVDVMRNGRRVVFLNCFVFRGNERIARGSATFQVVG